MSIFNDYFRAEVLSKILLSGPFGRIIAVGLMVLWAIWNGFRGIFRILAFPFLVAKHSAHGKTAAALSILRSETQRFGDRYSLEPSPHGNTWRYVTVSGNGFRTGFFKIAFLCHIPSGTLRAFLSRNAPRISGEIPPDEIAEILGFSGVTQNDVSIVGKLYVTLRKNYL